MPYHELNDIIQVLEVIHTKTELLKQELMKDPLSPKRDIMLEDIQALCRQVIAG